MKNQKIVSILLLLSLMASLYPEHMINPITMNLQNGEIKTAKILCLGKKGLIAWYSNMPYQSELLDEYAEYIPYQTIIKIQIKNDVNLAPIGTGLAGAAVLGLLGVASGNFIALFGAVLVGAITFSVGIFGAIISVFTPKYRSPNSFISDENLKIPYVKFIVNVPPELKTLIEENDKKL